MSHKYVCTGHHENKLKIRQTDTQHIRSNGQNVINCLREILY